MIRSYYDNNNCTLHDNNNQNISSVFAHMQWPKTLDSLAADVQKCRNEETNDTSAPNKQMNKRTRKKRSSTVFVAAIAANTPRLIKPKKNKILSFGVLPFNSIFWHYFYKVWLSSYEYCTVFVSYGTVLTKAPDDDNNNSNSYSHCRDGWGERGTKQPPHIRNNNISTCFSIAKWLESAWQVTRPVSQPASQPAKSISSSAYQSSSVSC